jgi:phosphoribosylformylglycinamidine (FGAM) synthase PurS component
MAKSTLIAIAHKPGVMDPVGHGLKKDIEALGLGRVKNVLSAQLFRLEGEISAGERSRIAQDLLCDPILQECQEHMAPKSLVVDIWYKTGVTDVAGESVLKGIRDLDIQGVEKVRTGMRYAFEGVTKREVAAKIALTLLVNPLVHDSTIHAD